MARRNWIRAAAIAAAAMSACAPRLGDYIWVDGYSAPVRPVEKDYIIGVGDVVGVRVYGQEGLSGRARVRTDGKISLPFVNDVQAAGLTTATLSDQLQKRLKDFLVSPLVTVSLEEPRPFEVYVAGEVARPGRYVLDASASLLQVLASAGGLSPYASKDRIFVLRADPSPVRIRFRYEALVNLEGKASGFRLRSGDTVVVE